MKKELQDLIQKAKDKQWKEGQGKELMTAIQKEQTEALKPVFKAMGEEMSEKISIEISKMASDNKSILERVADHISNVKVDSPIVNIPPIRVPEAEVRVTIPPIKVPTPIVNFDTSKIKIAPPVMPSEMKVSGEVSLKGVDLKHPLPVQLRDEEGKIVKLFENLTTLVGGGSSQGKSDFFTIKGFSQSAFSVPVNSDGEVKVAGTFTAGAAASTFVVPGNREGDVYNSDNPLPVTGSFTTSPAPQVSGYADSVNVMQYGGNDVTAGLNETTPGTMRVVLMTDSLSSVNVAQIGGAVAKVSQGDGASATGMQNILPMMVNATGTHDRMRNFAGEGGALRVQVATDAVASVIVNGVLGSIGATILNGEGLARDSWLVSDITNSIKAALVDSSGVQYSGSNPLAVNVRDIYGTSFSGSDLINSDNRLKVSVETGGSALTDAELRASHLDVQQLSGSIDSVYITGAAASTFAEIMNPDGRVKVELPTGSSGLTDTELRAAHLDVQQLSGSVDSVYVTGIFGSTMAGSEVLNGDNRIRVSVETGGSGLTDAELRASHLDVVQMSGTIDSVYITGAAASTFAEIMNPDGRVKVELPTGSSGLTDTELRATHLDVQQLSGSIDSVYVTGFAGTIGANIVDSSGVAYSGTNPVPISDAGGAITVDGTVAVSGVTGSIGATILNGEGLARDSWLVSDITNSIKAALVDSSGVQYSGTNPVPITGNVNVNGTLNSTLSVGPVVADVADDGSAPVQIGGIARTANPTPVADGDVVKATFDTEGRQIMRPIQVRDLIKTAYVQVANGTETTLKDAVAGAYLDCIMVTGSNDSDAAVSVNIRAVTGGNIVHTMEIPAYGLAGWAPSVPWPQDATGNNWTVDLPDITGTTISFSALFSQET